MRPAAAAPSFGVRFFGTALVVTSLVQMAVLCDRQNYWYLFQDLAPTTIAWRYAASWAVRVAGLAIGLGLLQRREVCRQAVLWLACGLILTAHLKHPYDGFVRHLAGLQQRWFWFALAWSLLPLARIDSATMTWAIVWLVRAQEIALGGLLLWYFTRPSVKAQFPRHAAP